MRNGNRIFFSSSGADFLATLQSSSLQKVVHLKDQHSRCGCRLATCLLGSTANPKLVSKTSDLVRVDSYLRWAEAEFGRNEALPAIALPVSEEIAKFNRAIEIVRTDDGFFGRISPFFGAHIVPLEAPSSYARRGIGFSNLLLRGAIFLSPPSDEAFGELELAANMAHELGHQSLFILQSRDRIILSDMNELVYSGIRRTERPAIKSFHAAVALGSMIRIFQIAESTRLYAGAKARDYISDRIHELKADLLPTLCALRTVRLSSLGRLLYADLIEAAYGARRAG